MIRGIDISAYQPKIDWDQVWTDKIIQPKFAIIKSTEGSGWQSRYFKAQWSGAEALFNRTHGNFFRAPYHFCRWETPGDPAHDAREEADYFYEVVGQMHGRRGVFNPIADVEWITGEKRDPDELVYWVRTFLERCEANFHMLPWLYMGPSFWRYCLLPDKRDLSLELTSWPLYEVDYNSPEGKPAAMKDAGRWGWTMHQYSGKGHCNGIYDRLGRPTLVDLNVFRGSIEDLKQLAQCG